VALPAGSRATFAAGRQAQLRRLTAAARGRAAETWAAERDLAQTLLALDDPGADRRPGDLAAAGEPAERAAVQLAVAAAYATADAELARIARPR
jgi:hypothetical protein